MPPTPVAFYQNLIQKAKSLYPTQGKGFSKLFRRIGKTADLPSDRRAVMFRPLAGEANSDSLLSRQYFLLACKSYYPSGARKLRKNITCSLSPASRWRLVITLRKCICWRVCGCPYFFHGRCGHQFPRRNQSSCRTGRSQNWLTQYPLPSSCRH